MNNRANPEIYPYSYDDTKLFQTSTARLREITSLIGEVLEPSIWLGNAEAYSLSFTAFGFPVNKISRLEWECPEPWVFPRQTTEFGLCTSPGSVTSNMNINVELISPQISNSTTFSYTNFRKNWNAYRWAEAKEEVPSTSAYQYYPVVYIKKGALCAYFTIKAVGTVPERFETQAAYESFFSSPAFSGTLEEWNAVKETYPNAFVCNFLEEFE